MEESIHLYKKNEVYIGIETSASILHELRDYFSFFVPNYQFMPEYKNFLWDGKIYLVNLNTKDIYLGLWPYIVEFADSRDYKISMTPDIYDPNDIEKKDIDNFLNMLKLPFVPRKAQIDSIYHCIKENRSLILSPTASGKSLIIYSILRWYGLKSLLIVPTQNLVSQMYNDFIKYSEKDPGFNVKYKCHRIMAGAKKDDDASIYISTWQSIYKMPKSYFEKFDVVIGDECHHFKSKSLMDIMKKLYDCPFRFGTTGTLDDSETHRMVLEGLFGRVYIADNTKNMMDNNELSKLKIKCVILKYLEQECKDRIKEKNGKKYQEEIKYIISHKDRNRMVADIASKQKDTTLVLFHRLEHGKLIYELIKSNTDKDVFYVAGDTDIDSRESIRQYAENNQGSIIVASLGVFATGINIRNLYNIIFASPSKAKIKILQSIGRGLRIGDRGDTVTLYDIVDDLSHKSYKNFAIKHFHDRIILYGRENFPYKIYQMRVGKS